MKKVLITLIVIIHFAMALTTANASSFNYGSTLSSTEFKFETANSTSLKAYFQRRKSVRVKSYTKKNGTRVSSHSRRAPKRH